MAVAYCASEANALSAFVQPAYAGTSWSVVGKPLDDMLVTTNPLGLQMSSSVPLLSKMPLASVCVSQYPGGIAVLVVMISVADPMSGVASGICCELPGER